ncbi:hypothetical protein CAQU_00070 [Corynebacterium aquilae DSM 44791]|uniref:ABC transporter domain-containing protein n=2 Tax=Corynebacterium aquilae TaxID=203263 RepID=A0A1L7CD33_9CORY|nr:hypothetical protein CAQU_00070 [Corynebacterium aquilae DSM 44791]
MPAYVGIVYFLVVTVALHIMGPAAGSAQLNVATQLGLVANKDIARALSSTATLDEIEQPQVAEDLTVFRSRQTVLGESFVRTYQAIFNLSVPLVLMVIAALTSPLTLLLIPACIPAIWVGVKGEKMREHAENELAPHQVRMNTMAEAVQGKSAATELRIYGATQWYIDKYRHTTQLWAAPTTRANLTITWLTALTTALYFAVGAGLIWSTAHNGNLSATTVTLMTVMQLSGLLSGIRFAYADLSKARRAYKRFTTITQLEDNAEPTSNSPQRQHTSDGIIASLHNVSYRYPAEKSYALEDITVDFPANSLVSIVGSNGSGKSTLAMLLRGVRNPTEGKITRPLRAYSNNHLNLAGIPQQPARWELRAYETATLPQQGSKAPLNNEQQALEASGATEVINSLKDKGQTPLGESWENPTQLSGGQWQRLGNARGLLGTDTAALTVIDEPTSALDALAEEKMVRSCRQIVEDSTNNGSVILITHRLSSALASDYIVMLDKGKIVATGRPRELLTTQNPFSKLADLPGEF